MLNSRIESVTNVTVPVRNNPFIFSWVAEAQGYEWVQGLDSQPRLVARSDSKDREAGFWRYAPLEDERLFLKFAALKSNRAAIRRFADAYGTLFDIYGAQTTVRRTPGAYRTEQSHGTSFLHWKREIERMRVLVNLWKAAKSARTKELQAVIVWKDRSTVEYRLNWSRGPLANSAFNKALLDRFKPLDVIKPAMYLLLSQINNRIADVSNPNYLAVVPRLVWCPGPRINGDAKPDHHLRIIFQPKDLLAAIWFQFARAVTEDYRLHTCEGCGELFQVGKGARRSHTKTCSSRCRKRISRSRS